MLKPDLDILIVASEVTPLARTGGLGDATHNLAKYLRQIGHNPQLIIPCYRGIQQKVPSESIRSNIMVPISNRSEPISIHRTFIEKDIPVYLVEKANYFDRSELYGTKEGNYRDNSERFIFFSRAVPELIRHLDLTPDIVHCHDWQTALVPLYIRLNRDSVQAFQSIRTVFTFHDLSYQGIFWCYDMQFTGLSWDYFRPDRLEFFGDLNLLKAGIIFSDALTTVSDAYCQAVQTLQHGQGLDGLLRARQNRFFGISNGIDCDRWNPEHDEMIQANFSADAPVNKNRCRDHLASVCNFSTHDDRLIAGVIGRLNNSRGMDILARSIPKILERDMNLCILGIGETGIERLIQDTAMKFPDRVAFFNTVDDSLAHQILAGSDMFLMPSRNDPGGMSHLQAMRYGSIPIARSTFGLRDTIENYDERTRRGTGVLFDEAAPDALLSAIDRAICLFREPSHRAGLLRQCMTRDVSGLTTANQYEVIYSKLLSGVL